MLQELTGLSSTTRLKVKKWRKSNFSIGKLLLKSVNVFIQFHSYTSLLHNYFSIIKCEMFRNIAHSDIYIALEFGQQNIQIQEISRESLETYTTKKFK